MLRPPQGIFGGRAQGCRRRREQRERVNFTTRWDNIPTHLVPLPCLSILAESTVWYSCATSISWEGSSRGQNNVQEAYPYIRIHIKSLTVHSRSSQRPGDADRVLALPRATTYLERSRICGRCGGKLDAPRLFYNAAQDRTLVAVRGALQVPRGNFDQRPSTSISA